MTDDQRLVGWIEGLEEELKIDAISFPFIVGNGRDLFNLEGPELESFVRLSILAMLRRGAVPVTGNVDGKEAWKILAEFEGKSHERVADLLVERWHRFGPEPDWDTWFSTRENANQVLPSLSEKYPDLPRHKK